jgi:aryl-alcohol dehydrogenase-like predicted oxidoreductase
MRYRQLGSSDLQVSEICLGSWLTYGGGVGDESAEACVAKAFELGINFIDTANVYAAGKAEEFLGKTLADRPRDSYILATKLFGKMPDGGQGLSREQIHIQIDKSLQRLRTDHVDLYQCHRYDWDTPLEETMQGLTEVVRAGKARYIGFSEWPADKIEEAVTMAGDAVGVAASGPGVGGSAADASRKGIEKFVSSQPQYSMIWRGPERDVIPVSKQHGISQIVWSPLAQGILTGKYKPGEPLPEGTRATSKSMGMWMDRARDQTLLERVQRLRTVAEGLGITLAQLAIAWVLREPNVASAIVGASRPEQVEDNVGGAGVELDESTLAQIDEILGDSVEWEGPAS